MLKVSRKSLGESEKQYPGFKDTVFHFENAKLPVCPICQSKDTAQVGCGMVGFSISVASATTKFKLTANGPKPGEFYCNACEKFFG